MCKRVHGSISGQISHPPVALWGVMFGFGPVEGKFLGWFPSAEDLVLLKLNLELDGTPILMMFRDR